MAEASESAPLVGQLLDGRYEILREIASGGMSVVYEARHVKIGRIVAIKVLHRAMAGDPEVVARFLNEARAVGTFGHPNIVASTDFGELPGHVPYLVLEYLEGHTLSKELENQGGLPVRRVARVALQIASALDAAHARDVIHRDLTSANIFLVKKEGNPDHVKVLDFGISKFLAAGNLGPKTRRGLTMGTPEFMAPEQISDPDRVDSRVDVYALGVIMYHMLAGQCPFTRTPLQSLLTQIVIDPPPPIDREGIPEELYAVVLKALSKNPSDRFASMREIGIELDRLSVHIFSGAEWEDGTEAVPRGFDSSGSAFRSAPMGRSGPMSVSGPMSISGPMSGFSSRSVPVAELPSVSRASPTGSSSVPGGRPTDPALAPRGRGLLFLALAVALGSLGGVAFLAVRSRRSTEGDAPPAAAPPTAALPTAASPPRAVSPEPSPLYVRVISSTPQARVTLRGRTHLLPFAQDLKPGSEPEVVELTAPGHEGKRFWITLDRPIVLAADLVSGHGVVEATEEDTVVALGGKPVGGEPPAEEAASAKVVSSPPHHVSSHSRQHAAGGLKLAKATGDHASPDSSPEPKAAPSPPASNPEPPAPKPVVAVAAPKADSAAGAPKVHPPSLSSASPGPAAPATARAPVARGLDPAKTQATVRSHLSEIQRCYDRAKMDNPDMKGRVTLRISVSETGGVTSAMIESSSLDSSSVESCIVETTKAWRFPAPVGGPAVISYPFNLR